MAEPNLFGITLEGNAINSISGLWHGSQIAIQQRANMAGSETIILFGQW